MPLKSKKLVFCFLKKKVNPTRTYIILSLLLVILAALNIALGSVRIPLGAVADILSGGDGGNQAWRVIVLQSRVPQCITALFCGAALSAAGLMLQTTLANPLAGPSILGITSGASLGVAVVALASGCSFSAAGSLMGLTATIAGALVGAFVVLVIILLLSSVIKSNAMLLIAGMMVGYVASSLISILNFFATAEGVHSYTSWGLGSFSGVSLSQMPVFVGTVSAGLLMAVLLIKPLNALLLGANYAENLGVNIRRVRSLLLVATGLLSAIVTAFCGPISFIGLAVPHVARMVIGSSNHNVLMPVTMLVGAVVALACNLVCLMPGNAGVLPLNAVTPFFGAPVVIYVIVSQRIMRSFE